MALDELEKALLNQKVKDVEKDFFEVIADITKVPVHKVHRVLLAYLALHQPDLDKVNWREKVPPDVIDAMYAAADAGAARLYVAAAVRGGITISVPIAALLPFEDDVHKICNGCPMQIECLGESLSTPEKCYRGAYRHNIVHVTPLRLTKTTVEVETTHPAGRYTVPLKTINFTASRRNR